MLWNEIRDHIRERLPAIIDFALFAMVITTITAVLLGLTWLYVNYGPALFLVAIVLIWIASGFAGPRAPTYLDDPGSSRSTALPPPGAPQIGRSNQTLTKHRPALPDRSHK
jgi:hypothetical protein